MVNFLLDAEHDRTLLSPIITACRRESTNLSAAFYLESEMLLSQVTKGNDNHCCHDFGNSREDSKLFNKQFNKYIIKNDTNQRKNKIAEQLDPSFQR